MVSHLYFELWRKLCLQLEEQIITLIFCSTYNGKVTCKCPGLPLPCPGVAPGSVASPVRSSGLEAVLFEQYSCFLSPFHILL